VFRGTAFFTNRWLHIDWRTDKKALKTLLAATIALGSLSLVSACGSLVGAGVGAAVGCAVADDCEEGAAVGGVSGAVAGAIIDPP
jgi:hypothetical protein